MRHKYMAEKTATPKSDTKKKEKKKKKKKKEKEKENIVPEGGKRFLTFKIYTCNIKSAETVFEGTIRREQELPMMARCVVR